MITIVKHDLIEEGFNFNNTKEIDYEKDINLISILVEEYPNGFEKTNSIYINNEKIEVENYDKKIEDNDVIIIMFHPYDPVSISTAISAIWAAIGTYVIQAAIAITLSYAVNRIFGSDIPDIGYGQDTIADGSPTYSLNNSQNSYRIGQNIPVMYGRVRTYPSLITPPYRVYKDNEQYLYLLMVIGQGQYLINQDDIYVNETRISDLSNDLIEYRLINSRDVPNETDIETVIGDDNYKQIIYTSPEVSDITITTGAEYYNYNMYFSGNAIYFGEDKNGNLPDFSLLSNGDNFNISGSTSNDTVEGSPLSIDTVDDINKVLTFGTYTFTTEPQVQFTGTEYYSGYKSETGNYFFDYTLDNIIDESYDKDTYNIVNYPVKKGDVITVNNAGNIEEYEVTYDPYWTQSEQTTEEKFVATFKVDRVISPAIVYGVNSIIDQKYTYCSVGFKKIFGKYSCNPEGTEAQYVEVDVVFPRGLYQLNNDNEPVYKSVKLEAIVETEDGNTDSTILNFDNNSLTPYRKTVRYSVNSPERLAKISFRRLTAETDDISVSDELHIQGIKTPIVGYGKNDYGDIQLLWVKAKASNALSASSQFKINCWAERADVQNNINAVLTDMYSNKNYGAGLDIDNLDLTDDSGAEFNGSFDSNISLLDAMKKVGRVAKISLFPNGQNIKTLKDTIKPLRTALFNESNMVKDTFKLNYIFGQQEETDGYEITYRDPDTFKPEVERYPEDSINPVQEELFGCISSEVALEEATYRYKSDKSRRLSVEFETDIQGLIPNYLDRIAVSHNVFEYGLPNKVTRVIDSNTLKFKEPINDTFDSIIFIDDNLEASDVITFTKVDDYTLTVNYPDFVHDIFTGDYEATKVTIGSSNKLVQDFLVTKVTPIDKNRVKIEGINYEPSIYS